MTSSVPSSFFGYYYHASSHEGTTTAYRPAWVRISGG